jgi:hypothetical protein
MKKARKGLFHAAGTNGLQLANDVAENVADGRADKSQDDNDDHRDEYQDQRVLNQSLAFFFGSE